MWPEEDDSDKDEEDDDEGLRCDGAERLSDAPESKPMLSQGLRGVLTGVVTRSSGEPISLEVFVDSF